MVDSICQEICNEISRLAAGKAALTDVLTSNDEKQLQQLTERMTSGHRRIMSAYTTLSETAKQLNPQLDPLPPEAKHSDESHVLDRLLEVLRDENEITRNVEERLRSELPPSR